MERSSTTAAPQASSSDAYPSPKVRNCCNKYTRGLAVITQRLEPLLETPSDRVSTGQLRWLTPLGFYAKQTHLPAQALQTIPITWSFAVWGLDLIGPLEKAPGGYTHLLVAIDKFSKWIEVRPLNNIRSEQAVAFFTNIIHRFGVPNSIITDNGT
jgi:transposase InsO family protein